MKEWLLCTIYTTCGHMGVTNEPEMRDMYRIMWYEDEQSLPLNLIKAFHAHTDFFLNKLYMYYKVMPHPQNTEIFSLMFLTTTVSFCYVSPGFNLVHGSYHVSRKRKHYDQKNLGCGNCTLHVIILSVRSSEFVDMNNPTTCVFYYKDLYWDRSVSFRLQ
jgi:hypothetical protein